MWYYVFGRDVMKIPLNSLIPLEQLIADVSKVLEVVNENGTVVLLQNNMPAYIITKYGEDDDEMQVDFGGNDYGVSRSDYKLHEAMKIVLEEQPDKTMHAADLADEIYRRRLYLKKNGGKAEATQIRARCANYDKMFESLPKNRIRLL
jgi:antitoxin Phd